VGFGVDIGELLGHWGYFAIFFVVLLGNVGLPVPEEVILSLAGYLSWRGELWLPIVLAVGILSAIIGDNLGYWIGRRYGYVAIERYGRRLLLTPQRLESARRFVARYGFIAVFLARFVPGLRFLAGPTAGAIGLRFPPFFISNMLGATLYVPIAVGVGYAIGYGAGDSIERLRNIVGEVEHIVLVLALLATGTFLAWRWLRVSARHRSSNK
jgi:membrane protein DedA with SNARE-associated domain